MAYLATLKHGHQAGKEKLDILSRVATEIETGQGDDHWVSRLEEVTSFFDKELYVHFRQEEVGLFPALITAVGREGVVAAMLGEHQSIWRAIDSLEEQLSAMGSVGGEDRKKLVQNIKMLARHIAGLLGAHIEKEDTMLFPLAERVLSPEALHDVAEQLETINS